MSLPRPILDFPLYTFDVAVWRIDPAGWAVRARAAAMPPGLAIRADGEGYRVERDGRPALRCVPGPDRPFLLAGDGPGVQTTRQLSMTWDCASPLKEILLPPGYTLRHFRKSDVAALGELYHTTFGAGHDAAWYQRAFLSSGFFQPERVFVVEHGGRIVSSALAWEEGEQPDPKRGVLHFVATHPDHHERGLGKAVSAAVLKHFRGDGRREVVLLTDDYRIRAIRAYRTLGFAPVQDGAESAARWENVLAALAAGYLL